MASDVAILVPVLDRPHRVEPLIRSIDEATPEPHRTVFACSDQATVDELDRMGAWYVRDEGGTWPQRINALYKLVDEPYIFTGADDLAFRAGWFSAVMRVMESIDGVVAVNDLHNGAGVHFVISKHYIDTMGCTGDNEPGVIACESYLHSYADDELRSVAASRGRFAHAKDAIVEHLHVGNGKAPNDSTYMLGGASMTQGREMYLSRNHLWS